jgi:hypothetical protein
MFYVWKLEVAWFSNPPPASLSCVAFALVIWFSNWHKLHFLIKFSAVFNLTTPVATPTSPCPRSSPPKALESLFAHPPPTTPPPRLYWNWLLKGLLWHICWPMRHFIDNCDKCDTWRKCDTHDMCHSVSQCDTMAQKKFKNAKSTQIRQLRMEVDGTHFDTLTCLWHQKSSNLMHYQKTDEGTVGAPTCLVLAPKRYWSQNKLPR